LASRSFDLLKDREASSLLQGQPLAASFFGSDYRFQLVFQMGAVVITSACARNTWLSRQRTCHRAAMNCSQKMYQP
ncbi:hypothetical protein, partial [Pseudomonas sp. HY2-MNA-CIBAN-0224]|uniref:hypothetical protein n=1 Tax=Pseudomonas sp. HY2-MNA-CIBAN-0224 TaxID=3140471 RepID=UPI003323793D